MALPLRVGVVGCGLIAQVMHLPHLAELGDSYEIAGLCDVSEPVAAACASRYHVKTVRRSWQDLVAERLDVVLVLTSGSHAPIAVAAAQAGSHVFVEKPMCLSLAEGREMYTAARDADVRLMVGNMKRYDPAYQRLQELMPSRDLRLVSVTTLASPFEPYVEAYPLAHQVPPPADVVAALRADDDQRLAAALPGADAEARYCYRWMLLDNLVHELNMLRGVLGEPDRVHQARLSRTVCDISLAFGGTEVHMSWVDLPGMAQYKQELAFYALDRRVTLTLPSPYLRNMPSQLTIETGREGTPFADRTLEIVSYEEAFKRELVEFAAAIEAGRAPRTDVIEGLHDIALCRAIVTSHITRQPVDLPSALPDWAQPHPATPATVGPAG
ncbi:MAG TPA: Gfo/Idh/MocA family oxidoreductase [Streptosporangiaceae bacterium]|jgi:predicted dehydrogenase